MADNENLRNPNNSRRNPHTRPHPGVQKAINIFGVRDLRELINKKHEQGDLPTNMLDSKKLPPPDPSYNYLKDPSREEPKPSPSENVEDNKKPKERIQKHREQPHYRHRNEHREDNQKHHRQEHKNSHHPVKPALKETTQNNEEGNAKKELRFVETPVVENDFSRGGRSSLRGRNPRRGRGGKPREEKIENPINIKVQLSTETGVRSCTLDENTKIADIKHVPDQEYSLPRGATRSRGNSRGRGRGRGSLRGRGRRPHHGENPENSWTAGNIPEQENKKESDKHVENNERTNEESGQYYEQETGYIDNNENSETEYNDTNTENLNKSPVYESSPESEQYDHKSGNNFDPNLGETIMITSSKFQDGEVERLVEVSKETNIVEDVPKEQKSE